MLLKASLLFVEPELVSCFIRIVPRRFDWWSTGQKSRHYSREKCWKRSDDSQAGQFYIVGGTYCARTLDSGASFMMCLSKFMPRTFYIMVMASST